jgi:hypothetical protein
MSFIVRQILSKSVLMNLERDLSGSIATQVATVPAMVDNFLAPQAYAYQPQQVFGAYQTTGRRSSPAVDVQKVYIPMKNNGLFSE